MCRGRLRRAFLCEGFLICGELVRKGAFIMRVLRFLKRCLDALLGSSLSLPTGIDSHRWESKIKVLGHFHG